jgi:predicted outer membrane repeat protein
VRVFEVGEGAKLVLKGLTIADGRAPRDGEGPAPNIGGGIYNGGTLGVINSTFSGNNATGGGAIEDIGTLEVVNSTFSGNDATGGGAIDTNGNAQIINSTFSGNSATSGGAITVRDSGSAEIIGSTFSGNSATGGGAIENVGTLRVTNSTFSGNSAHVQGSVIANLGTTEFTNSTLFGNSAIALDNYSQGKITVSNTILASFFSGSGANCEEGIEGMVTDGGFNIEKGTSCGFSEATGSLSNTDPLFDPAGLQDNGGPTKTIALQPDSPAVDLVGQEACPPPQTDQRGVERPQGEACDSGAFELVQGLPPYAFSGFFSPVNNPPTLNILRAGAAVPVKFSLGGNEGLDIFAEGYPKSQPISCSTSAPLDPIEQTMSAGGSSLSYNATSERYTYTWKTKKAWSGTCRQLVVKLDDGSVHRANFKFR